MATISFKLRGKGEFANLCFRLREGKKIDLLHTSDIQVEIAKWDNKKATIKGTNTIGKAELETKISDRKAILYKVFDSLDKASVTNANFNLEIDKVLNPSNYKVEKPIVTLFDYIESFIEKAPQRKDKATGRLLTYNNIQQYKATYKHLQAFAIIKRKTDFEFKEINKKFYDGFVAYLQSEILAVDKDNKTILNKDGSPKLAKKAFTQNSVGKHIRVLKLMLNDAPKHLVEDAEYSNFHVFTEEVDTIYLNESELEVLQQYDFSNTPHLDRVRDWFLLLAWTGCRFSDLEKIGKTDIRNNFITFRQQKTNAKVVIPLHPIVKEILNKYDYNLPEPISNQRFNEYIKEVAKRAGLTQTEATTSTIGGDLTTTKQPKYELVSSHTGRRSFATNMYLQGVPSLTIMAITGHKTEKSFLKYIRIKQEEHAELMAQAWGKTYEKQ